MNANGKEDKGGTPADRRKNAISNIIHKHRPDIVLFQEFSWAGINGKTWSKWPIPDNYEYKGHYDASIMIDSEHVVVQDLPANDIDIILSDLQRTSNNRLKKAFPTDFTPVPRMCLTKVMVKTKPSFRFYLHLVAWDMENVSTKENRIL
ncbi:hypothetical protein DPMN_187337 [Dreissena polymorpha]|uniref:Endonuclease/exonuclease/phosphatase domain-containing protein n=1 Tax=Dreissena polymorpha TaxID=45954 RepID=A0A9D4I7E5_DREPO|nr:hypothetical protein DPMN_187337 [Dreissena polymorpha]